MRGPAMSARAVTMSKSNDQCAGTRYRLCFVDRARDQGITPGNKRCIKLCTFSEVSFTMPGFP